MRTTWLLLSAGLVTWMVTRSPAEEAGGPPPTAALVARLGSGEFVEREAATRELDRLGASALDALRQAVRDPDPEVRRRAVDLVWRIEKRVDVTRLMESKPIHLVYKDVPVDKAVADLAKMTGFPIKLDDKSRVQLMDRKVTLDTGDTTFWEAYTQFCQQAGLVDKGLLPPVRPAAPARPQREISDGLMVQTIIMNDMSNATGRTGPVNPDTFTLADGKAPPVPTFQDGALRIRALPPSAVGSRTLRKWDAADIHLEITPEPRVQWRNLLELRIDKVLDEHGQLLDAKAGGGLGYSILGYGNNVVYYTNGSISPDHLTGKEHGGVPVTVKWGKKPSNFVKEIRGTVTAQIQTPVEPLLSMNEVLKSKGKTVSAPDGSSLKVFDVKKERNGQYRVRLELQRPMLGMGMVRVWGGGGRMIAVAAPGGGVMFVDESTQMNMSQLALLDRNGKAFRIAGTQVNSNGVNLEYTMTYQPVKDQAEPDRLVYNGQRMVVADIPFVLRDVPLP